MNIQIVDRGSNMSPKNIMQAHELREIIEYAEKWAEISNNPKKNRRVKSLCDSINTTMDLMIAELPK
jgi:hypothetical protein